jgi:hypothetical protein
MLEVKMPNDTQVVAIHYESIQDKNYLNEWRVEGINIKLGDVLIAVFCGPLAQERANEYALFKNGRR